MPNLNDTKIEGNLDVTKDITLGEGNTLTATLEELENRINKKFQPNMMTLGTAAGEDLTIEISSSYEEKLIPISTINQYVGNGIQKTGHSIFIADDISYVEVSATVCVFTSPTAGEVDLKIIQERNGSRYDVAQAQQAKTTNALTQLTLPPKLFKVAKGDAINLHFSASNCGSYQFIGRGMSTYLTVKKIA